VPLALRQRLWFEQDEAPVRYGEEFGRGGTRHIQEGDLEIEGRLQGRTCHSIIIITIRLKLRDYTLFGLKEIPR
jgi:hypothetical protein